MKLLITGANGQLGRGIIDASQSKGCRVQAPSEEDLDITDLAKVDRIITDLQPNLVINTAAYTQVDQAETEEALAFKINKTGCTHLAQICANNQIPLIHISTDYVFDGRKGAPYLETDPISPIGVYGRSKAEGEIEIRSILKEHIILRTSWLYGIHGQNFVKTMLGLATGQKEIRVVADQYGSPTNAADIARRHATAFPDRMQRDGSRIRHGDGAGIEVLGGLDEVRYGYADIFGIGAIAARTEIVVVPATGKLTALALVAFVAGKHRRDRDEFVLLEARHIGRERNDATAKFMPAYQRHLVSALDQHAREI